MSIECYYRHCPNHLAQTVDDEGPFCRLDNCVASIVEMNLYSEQRAAELAEYNRMYPNFGSPSEVEQDQAARYGEQWQHQQDHPAEWTNFNED